MNEEKQLNEIERLINELLHDIKSQKLKRKQSTTIMIDSLTVNQKKLLTKKDEDILFGITGLHL